MQKDRVPRCRCRPSRLNRQRVRVVAEVAAAAAAVAVLEQESVREVPTDRSQQSCNTGKDVLSVGDLRVE